MSRLETSEDIFMSRLEIPIFGAGSAHAAMTSGASRLELNRTGSYVLGGTTPTVQELAAVKSAASAVVENRVAVRVMIRPRGAPAGGPDFLYDEAEMQAMRRAIVAFKDSGLLDAHAGDGFVFGILNQSSLDGLTLDADKNTELVRLARPFQCVFHRAFDDVLGYAIARTSTDEACDTCLDQVIDCGFDGILTSGGPGNAPQNAAVLKQLFAAANGRIEIIVGGGVRSANVRHLQLATGMQRGWIHSSCLTASSAADEAVDELEVKAILREIQAQ